MRRRNWAVLVLALVLLSGCSALGGSPGSAGAGSVTTPPTSPNWISVAQGKVTTSPTPRAGAVSATPTAAGFLPPRTGPPAPARTRAVVCSPNTANSSEIAGAGVAPSTTSAVVSWYSVGGDNLVQFRLTAISQDLVAGKQRDVGFVTVVPGAPCGPMSARISGLDRKTGYVFSVDAVVVSRSGAGTHAATVARSTVIYTR